MHGSHDYCWNQSVGWKDTPFLSHSSEVSVDQTHHFLRTESSMTKLPSCARPEPGAYSSTRITLRCCIVDYHWTYRDKSCLRIWRGSGMTISTAMGTATATKTITSARKEAVSGPTTTTDLTGRRNLGHENELNEWVVYHQGFTDRVGMTILSSLRIEVCSSVFLYRCRRTCEITARHDLRAEERKQPLTLDGELFQGTRLLASLSAAL
jgi:hypothetical protein